MKFMTIVTLDTNETAKERYTKNLEMITTGKGVDEGKEARVAYLSGVFSQIKGDRAIISVPVKYLAVNRLYQTTFRTERDSKLLESKFDWNLFGVITATLDLENGVLVVEDGQMRTRVVYKKENYNEKATVPVMVILNAPKDYAERTAFEARLFINQNIATKKVTANEKLEAQAENGELSAIHLLNLLKEYKINRTTLSCQLPADTIRDTETYRKFISNNGREGGVWLFDIYKESGFHSHPSAFARAYAKAFMGLYNGYPEYRKEIKNILIPYLRNEKETTKTPHNLTFLADQAGYSTANERKYFLFLEDVVVKELGIEKRRRVA